LQLILEATINSTDEFWEKISYKLYIELAVDTLNKVKYK